MSSLGGGGVTGSGGLIGVGGGPLTQKQITIIQVPTLDKHKEKNKTAAAVAAAQQQQQQQLNTVGCLEQVKQTTVSDLLIRDLLGHLISRATTSILSHYLSVVCTDKPVVLSDGCNPGLHQKSQTSNSNQISNRRISRFEISHFKPAFGYSA